MVIKEAFEFLAPTLGCTLSWNTEGGEHSCPLSHATSGKDRVRSSLPGKLGPPLHTCLSLGLPSCCLRWQEAFPELLRDGFVGKRDKKDIKGEAQ